MKENTTMFGIKEWLALLLLISVPVAISVVTIMIDRFEDKFNKRKIDISFITKIRNLCGKIILEEKKLDKKNSIVIRSCERWIRHWLDKANVVELELRKEIRDCCYYNYDDNYVEKLKELGWIILNNEDLK